MEQGWSQEKSVSTSSKSSGDSSEQKQLHSTGSTSNNEVNQVCQRDEEMRLRFMQTIGFQPSNLELLFALQSKAIHETGTSLSSAPFIVELLSSHATNEDLYAVYMQGMPYLCDQQLFLTTQVPYAYNMLMLAPNAQNYEAMNTYCVPSLNSLTGLLSPSLSSRFNEQSSQFSQHMEKGSPEKSPPPSSEQRNQVHSTEQQHLNHELNCMLHPLSQGCQPDKDTNFRSTQTTGFQPSNLELLTSLQSKQAVQTARASILSVPISGELPAQSLGTNEVSSAVYLQGIPGFPDQHLFQPTQVPSSDNTLFLANQLAQNACNNEVMSKYNLHLSNLPMEFRLPSAFSKFDEQFIRPSHFYEPFDNFSYAPSIDVNTQQAYWKLLQGHTSSMMGGTSVPLSLPGVQGITNPMNVSSGFNLATGNFNYTQIPPISKEKRKMIWPDDNAPSYKRWSSFMRDRGQTSSSFNTSNQRYTLYDKRYEEIGISVDPHLRIFNATSESGKRGSLT